MSAQGQTATTTDGSKVSSNGNTSQPSLKVNFSGETARPPFQQKPSDTTDHVLSVGIYDPHSSDGDAYEPGSDVDPVSDTARPLSPQELSNAFIHVPWMEFNVTARPNIKAFSNHPAIRQVISQVAHGTLDDIKDAITVNVMNSINDIVSKAVKDATEDVPKHVMNNITKTFNGLSLVDTDTPTTDFQRLQSPDMIDDYDLDNVSNRIGNLNFGHDNGDTIIFPVTPGSFPSHTIPNPDIGAAKWIWTHEKPFHQPPSGPRAFRRTAILPPGHSVDSMIIDITCDDLYTLYVNGFVVGHGTDWEVVQRYSIKLPKTRYVLIAVYASNSPVLHREAGLLASAVMWNSKNYSENIFQIPTNETWMTSITATANGFERPSYRQDGSWSNVRVEGSYGVAPWKHVTKPTTTSSITAGFSNLGIRNPPSAPLATPGPDSDGKITI